MRGNFDRASRLAQYFIAFAIFASMSAATIAAQTQEVTTLKVLAPDSTALQRIRTAHGLERMETSNFVAQATVTLQTSAEPVVVAVTIIRSGEGSQRIEFKQSDGKMWDGNAMSLEPVGRRVLEFVEMQHARALPNIFKASARNAQVVDGGTKEGTQLLDVREPNGTATRYSIETGTSRVRRMEFQRGQSRDAAGKLIPNTETYLYSDFRPVTGISTAFKVEHYSNGTKKEDLTFTSVRYIQTPAAAIVAPGGQR